MKLEKKNLISVKENEQEVQDINEKLLKSYDNNTPGPESYLKNYFKYLYILSGEAKESLDKFFATEPFPYLKVRYNGSFAFLSFICSR